MEEKHHREEREREREKKSTINSSAVDSRPFAADRLAGGPTFRGNHLTISSMGDCQYFIKPKPNRARVCVHCVIPVTASLKAHTSIGLMNQ